LRKKVHTSTVLNVNIQALSVHLIISLLFSLITGLSIYSYNIGFTLPSGFRNTEISPQMWGIAHVMNHSWYKQALVWIENLRKHWQLRTLAALNTGSS